MATAQGPERRRSTRIRHKVRVILSGTDVAGHQFAEDTETVQISKHGASVRTSYEVSVGQEVSVRTKEKDRVGQFEVVCVGRPESPNEGLIGLEFLEGRRFWGVDFPPEDWTKE